MLGMFAQTNVVRLLTSDTPLRIKVGKRTMVIEGREYSNTIDSDPFNYEPMVRNVDFNIVVNHGMLLDKEYIPGIRYTMTKDIMSPADITIGGHYHYGFKEHESNGGMFFNPGSLLRTEASKGNKTFQPKTLLFDIQDNGAEIEYTYKYIPLQCVQDSMEIFDFNNIQQKKDSAALLDQFKQFVVNTSSVTASSSIEDMIQDVAADNGIDQTVTLEALDRIQASHTNDVDSLQAKGFMERKGKLFITKMTLENFQSHAKTEVDFTDGFNVIIGETNSGKTSLLRGLQWVLYNEPKGSDFIRTGADDCSVSIELSDGHVITRSRSRSSAGEYLVTNPSGVTQTYKGFGTDIPIEIFNAHQMPLVELSKGTSLSLNVASQLEGPFLLSMNPSEKANAIGRIIGSQVLDGAIKEVSKEVGNLTKEVSSLKKQLEVKENDKKQYDFLPDYKTKLEEAVFLHNESVKADESIESLAYTMRDYQDTEAMISNIETELRRFENLPLLEASIPKLKSVQKSLSEMVILLESFHLNHERIVELTDRIESIFDIRKTEKAIQGLTKEYEEKALLEKNLDRYLKADQEVKDLEQKLSSHKKISDKEIKKAEKIQKEISELTKAVLEYEAKYKLEFQINQDLKLKSGAFEEAVEELEKEQVEFKKYLSKNKVCPLCETPLSDHTIAHIVGEN